jgi:inorganic pyrophosphatase
MRTSLAVAASLGALLLVPLALSCQVQSPSRPRHLWNDFDARNPDGTINVVVEIPAGTTAKWEVDKDDGVLKWEERKGKPRIVRYLGYPGNYGMVPRTLLPEELGGDGDPLDVLVLGEAVDQGAVVKARVVGVLRLLDDGEQDDKLLAVTPGSPLAEAEDIDSLDSLFPGITRIVETWFTSYKGPGRIQSRGFAGVSEATRVLAASVRAYEERRSR